MIPSFSLPGLSIGSAEAEGYLRAREAGVGRGRASSGLLARGMAEGYPKSLEKRLVTAVNRGKALFVGFGCEQLRGLAWVASVVGDVQRPLVELNRFCQAHGANAVCFCRASILPCSRPRRRDKASHDHSSAAAESTAIASGP